MNKSVRGVLKINDFILLIKRIKNNELYFVFPGGHKKEGESDGETCQREFKEETNLDVVPVDHIKDIEEGASFTTSYYLCSLKKPINDSRLPELKVIGPELGRDPSIDFYKPIWISISKLKGKTIYPVSIVKMIIHGKI